jgi:hypothetical protein
MPMPVPAWDIFPFICEELHLMGYGHSVYPFKVYEFFIALNFVILYVIQSFAIPRAEYHTTSKYLAQLTSVLTINLLLYIQKFHPQSHTWL